MKYISIDIETTGLNPETCDVLEVGAYLEDTTNPLPREELPFWHRYIWKENYRGEPFALAMNVNIFKKILEQRKKWMDGETGLEITSPEGLAFSFSMFLEVNGCDDTRMVVAGKKRCGV